MNKLIKNKFEEISITAPSFFWIILFFVIPSIIIFTFPFKPADIYGGIGSGWTLSNFKTLFSGNFFVIVQRTIILSALTTFICFIISLPVGYYIARASEKWRQILILLIVLPFWSSFIVRIYAWKALLHPEGLLKNILVFFKLVSPDAILLYNPETVLLVMVYSYLPFAILPIYAASSKFDFQLFEAGMDLGMSPLMTFFKIYLPGIRKGINTAIVMVFVPALGAYVIPDIVGGPTSEMIGNKIVQKTFVDRNLPQASGLSALLSLAIFLPLMAGAIFQVRAKKAQPLKEEIFHGGAE